MSRCCPGPHASQFPQNATVGVSALAGGSAASGGGSNGSASRAVRLPSVGESSCAHTRSHPLTPLLTRPRVCCSPTASNEAGRVAREPHARTSAHAHRDPGLAQRLKRQSTASHAASDSTGTTGKPGPPGTHHASLTPLTLGASEPPQIANGVTNAPFKHTFKTKTVKEKPDDPHEPTITTTEYPGGAVSAPGYLDSGIEWKFTA
jgi:hypothetical protein